MYDPVPPNVSARCSIMKILNLSESHCRVWKKLSKLLSTSLPMSPSRVFRAPAGTSLYHFVPKHLRAPWPRREQSYLLQRLRLADSCIIAWVMLHSGACANAMLLTYLLPVACYPIDNRRKRQKRTKGHPSYSQFVMFSLIVSYFQEIKRQLADWSFSVMQKQRDKELKWILEITMKEEGNNNKILVPHVVPVYPGTQIQVYPLMRSLHVAPFRQGLLSHLKISGWTKTMHVCSDLHQRKEELA